MYDGVFYCAKCLLITSVLTRVVKEQSHSEKRSFISAHLSLKTEFTSEFFTGESHSTDWKISLPKAPKPANTVVTGHVSFRIDFSRVVWLGTWVKSPDQVKPASVININQSTEDGQKEEMIRQLCEHFMSFPSQIICLIEHLSSFSLSLSFLY